MYRWGRVGQFSREFFLVSRKFGRGDLNPAGRSDTAPAREKSSDYPPLQAPREQHFRRYPPEAMQKWGNKQKQKKISPHFQSFGAIPIANNGFESSE